MTLRQDDSQQKAYYEALNAGNKNLLITGHAGTGKTTLIGEIAKAIGQNCLLASPTGKAAARIRQKTGLDACTIHRLLGYDGEVFRRREPLIGNTLIIDEASMLDSSILAKVISYTPQRLILVGDASQLLPVGRGSPFSDLINIFPESVCTLETCHRASGAIHMAATAIRNGESPVNSISGGESFKMISTGDAGPTTDKLIAWIKSGAYDPLKDAILSPRYGNAEENDAGIDALNKAIKSVVNPSEDSFAEGDRVLFTKNHSEFDVWNGDTGTINRIDVLGNMFIIVDGKDDEQLISKEMKREIKHAYCLSVHKAQGSEYRRVFYVCLKRHKHQMSRNLTYTAVTRAREGCCVIGEPEAFYHSINKVQVKRTVLQMLGGKLHEDVLV